MSAYYNENNEFCADWLENLIAEGEIAPGDVDRRDIRDVRPDDLRGYRQCHFFAGIGIWSAAARRAGWPDDRPLWTGSCPCQPFSTTGRKRGFADERHLWPHWHWLIFQLRPRVVFGEQVASKDGLAWFDLVSADLEGTDYAGWVNDICSAGFGSPNIRQRLYFVAERMGDAVGTGSQGHAGDGDRTARWQIEDRPATSAGASGWLADADGRNTGSGRQEPGRQHREQPQDGRAGGMADTLGQRRQGERLQHESRPEDHEAPRNRQAGGLADPVDRELSESLGGPEARDGHGPVGPNDTGRAVGTGPVNGFWRDADWLGCRDGKWRPVQSGSFPLAPSDPTRLGRISAYGNAINLEVATEFIAAYLEHDAHRNLRPTMRRRERDMMELI